MDEEQLTFEELLVERQRSRKQASASRRPAEQEPAARAAAGTEVMADGEHPENSQARARFHRENKNRPTEATAKRPVGRHRDVLQAGSGRARDPRFEELCGKLDSSAFDKRYGFIYDDVMASEAADLEAALKKTKQQERAAELKAQIKELERTVAKQKQQAAAQQQEAQEKAQERQAVKQGKRPFYLKASEKRKLALVSKYNALKASGGLDKALAKRRQKVASKDHRLLPRGRRTEG